MRKLADTVLVQGRTHELLALHDYPGEGNVRMAIRDLESCVLLLKASHAWLAQLELYGHDVEARDKCRLRADRYQRLAWRAHEAAFTLLSRDLYMSPPGVGGRASGGRAPPPGPSVRSARPPARGA